MTETITLNLTLDELKQIDKFVELNDETRPLFDKIRNAYPKPTTLFDVIRNLGYSIDMCYEIVVAVEEFEKSKEKEMIKKNLKTSLQELVNGDVRPIDDVVRETKNQQIKELVRESVKWCEEHPEESVEDYLKPQGPQGPVGPGPGPKGVILGYEPTPQTPEFLKFELGKTLEGLIEEWWIDVFTRNSDLSMEESIDCLVTMICYWLPKEQSAAGSQSLGVEDMIEGFNDAIKKIKSKLR